jgi:hypothetical protein
MNSLTLPRWFGRRKNKSSHESKSETSHKSCKSLLENSADRQDLNNQRFPALTSPTRPSKSTCDLPSSIEHPLATSEETTRGTKRARQLQAVSEHNLNIVPVPTHDDIISARQNLRKCLSTRGLPIENGHTYENFTPVSHDPEYQNFSGLGLYRHPSNTQLSILDETDEPVNFDRLHLQRASRKLFASQRDVQNYQNIPALGFLLPSSLSLGIPAPCNSPTWHFAEVLSRRPTPI